MDTSRHFPCRVFPVPKNQWTNSLQEPALVQNILWAGAHPVVLSQIDPTYSPGRINQELRRSRDVTAVLAHPRMYQIVTTNHFRVSIGEKRKAVTRLLHQVPRLFRRVSTDRNRTNARLIETSQIVFNAPQLGVARGSPVTSVKDKQHTLRLLAIDGRRQQLIQRDLPARCVRQPELRHLLAHLWSTF